MVFQLGNLTLTSHLFLSPLAGYTNLPFRLTVREIGGIDLATTDLVNARSLLERNPKALKLIETTEEDRPLAVQLFGGVAEEMRDAAVYLGSLGISSIDINMGCPVSKVCRVGAGSSLMNDLSSTTRLVRGMVNALTIPVTAKMRLGWDDNNITAPDLARALEDAGVQAVFIHGRTREQGFSGRVNLPGIRSVVEATRAIPVIGNGDITTPEAAKEMMEFTGCQGVSVGRGAFYNPWIFRDIQAYLEKEHIPAEPKFSERIRVMRRHLTRMIEVFGEERGCIMFRKVGPWYAKRFGPASLFNREIVRIQTRDDFEKVVAAYIEWRAQFLDDEGELLSKYRPAALATSFETEEREPAATRRESIPVPKGPVEVW